MTKRRSGLSKLVTRGNSSIFKASNVSIPHTHTQTHTCLYFEAGGCEQVEDEEMESRKRCGMRIKQKEKKEEEGYSSNKEHSVLNAKLMSVGVIKLKC